MKTGRLIVSGLFAIAAAVQINDPDPFFWLLVYGLGAVLTLESHRNRLPLWTSMYIASVCIVAGCIAVYLLFGKYSLFGSEQGNEALGLLLTGGWIFFLIAFEQRN